jgi:hypothetical protein
MLRSPASPRAAFISSGKNMAKKTEVAGNPELDSTLPDVTLELGGKTYHLLFTFAALSIAEKKLQQQGIRIGLLVARNVAFWDASNLPYILFAALVTHHPKMTFDEVSALVDFESCELIADKLMEAYQAAMPKRPEKSEGDPTVEPAPAP